MFNYRVKLTTTTNREQTIRAASREAATAYARKVYAPKSKDTTLAVNILSEEVYVEPVREEE